MIVMKSAAVVIAATIGGWIYASSSQPADIAEQCSDPEVKKVLWRLLWEKHFDTPGFKIMALKMNRVGFTKEDSMVDIIEKVRSVGARNIIRPESEWTVPPGDRAKLDKEMSNMFEKLDWMGRLIIVNDGRPARVDDRVRTVFCEGSMSFDFENPPKDAQQMFAMYKLAAPKKLPISYSVQLRNGGRFWVTLDP